MSDDVYIDIHVFDLFFCRVWLYISCDAITHDMGVLDCWVVKKMLDQEIKIGNIHHKYALQSRRIYLWSNIYMLD